MKLVFKRIISLTLAFCLCLTVLPAMELPSKAVTPAYSVSSAYKSSSYYSKLCEVVLTGNQRDDIINVALSQVGYNEGSYDGDYSGANDGSYSNYTEYNYWYHNNISSGMPVGGSYAPWCATFVSWCAEQANIPTSILKRSTAAGHTSSYFNLNFYSGSSTLASSSDNDSYFKGYNYTPQKGDLFYTRSWSHVGLVVGVDGAYVTTVEGNTNSGGSAEGEGVFVRTRAIADLYFGVPNYVVSVHTCDAGELVSYEDAHPHHSCYKCSVCGKQWTDDTTTNIDSDCLICQRPGKPVITGMNTSYADYERVMFQWTDAENTTHYNIRLEANHQGTWELYEQITYASSGTDKLLPVGEYRFMVQAYNNNCWNEDGSDWVHSDSDYAYFTVTKSYHTVTFDGNGGFTPITSQTVWNGGTIGELPEPQRYGYAFTGWYLNKTGDGAAVLPSMVVEGDITLYACWEEVINTSLTLSYPSLSFEDEIRYNIYFTVENIQNVTEMGLLTFAYHNTSGTIDNALEIIPGYVSGSDGTCAVQTNGIPAKNLGDTLYFKVYAKLTNGSYVYSNVAGYHAVAYANTVLNNSNSSSKAKALVVAMLNYGAAAQVQFNYKPYNLMNANLTDAQKALVKAYDASMVASIVKADTSKSGSFVMNGGYSNIFPTVSFEGAFSINFYFTPNKTVSTPPTFYYWDAATYNSVSKLSIENATGILPMKQDGSNWGAAVEGIAAKEIDETIYVAGIYTSNSSRYPTNIISYSLGKYCQDVAAQDNAFGAATAVYGYYAKAYFSN